MTVTEQDFIVHKTGIDHERLQNFDCDLGIILGDHSYPAFDPAKFIRPANSKVVDRFIHGN